MPHFLTRILGISTTNDKINTKNNPAAVREITSTTRITEHHPDHRAGGVLYLVMTTQRSMPSSRCRLTSSFVISDSKTGRYWEPFVRWNIPKCWKGMVYLPIHERLKLIINGSVNISSPMEHMGYQTVTSVFLFRFGVKTHWFQPGLFTRVF